MKKTGLALALALLLLAVLAYLFLQPSPPLKKTTSLPSPAHPAPKAQIIPDKRITDVEKILKNHRAGIGTCLRDVQEGRLRDLRITVIWNPLGKLEKVRLAPSLGEKYEMCIFDLLVGYQIPPAGDLAPLAVTQRLRMGL